MGNNLEGFVPYVQGTRGSGVRHEFISQPGCYAVIIKVSGKIYVGSTSNLVARINTNISSLKYNQHGNRELQEAYNADPNIEVLVCPTNTVEEAQRLEQATVDKFLPTGNLTNRGVIDVTRPALGLPMSDENKQRLREAHLGVPLSEEHKRKLAETNRGQKRSEETCIKIGQAKLGAVLTEEHKRKISETQLGRPHEPHTEEAKQKMSVSQKERFSTAEGKAAHALTREKLKDPVIIDDVTYPSVTEAARALGVDRSTITARCKSDKHPGYSKQDKNLTK